jgi:hypothetical protein
MDLHELTRDLNIDNGPKIALAVADGLGGPPTAPGGLTKLGAAASPNLEALGIDSDPRPDDMVTHSRRTLGFQGEGRFGRAGSQP